MANFSGENKASPIIHTDGDRMVVDTRLPHANLMHDASRPFAVCEKVFASRPGRVTTKGRYSTLVGAKRALNYLR